MSDIDNLIRKYNNGLSIEDLKPKEPEQPEMPSMAESFGKNAFNNVEALYSGLLNFAGTMQANSDDPYNQLRGEYMRQGADWLEKDMQQRAATMPQKNFGGFFDAVTNPDYYTNPLGLAADLGQSFGSFVGMFPMTVFTPEIAMPAQMARAGAQLFGKMGASKLASAASKYYMNKLAQDAVENTIAKSGIEKAIETFGKERVAATLKNPIQSAVGNSFNWAAKSFLPDAASNAGSMRSDMEENGITDTGEQWNRMVGEFATEAPADFLSEYLEGAILGGKLGRAIGGPNAGRVRRAAQNLLIGAPVNMANEGLQEGAQQVSTNYWSGGDDLMEGVPESIRAGAFGGAGPSFVGSVNQLMTATPHEGKGTTQDNTPTNKETTNVQEYAEEQGDNTEDSAVVSESGDTNNNGYLANDDALNGFDSNYIKKYESAPGKTDLAGVRDDVKSVFNQIAKEYSEATDGDTITITGGAEKGIHAEGEYGHEGGWKLDVDNEMADPQKFFEICEKHGVNVGDEGDHFDLGFNAESGVGGTQVVFGNGIAEGGGTLSENGGSHTADIGDTATDADDAFAWLNSRTPDDFDDYDEATQTSETFNRVQREFGDIFGKQKDGHETIKPGQEETFNELYNKYKTDIDSYKEEQRAQGLTAPQGTAPQPRDVGVAPTIETSETPAIDRAKPVVKTKAEAEQSGMTTEIKGNPIQPYLPNRPIPMTNPNATGTINAAPIQGAPQYAQNVNRPTNGLLGNITTQAAPAQAQMINNQPVNMQGAPQTGVVNPMAPIVQRQAQPTVSQQMANMGAPVRQMGATVGMPNIVSQNTRPAQPILLLGAGKGNALNDAANMIGGNQNVSTQGNENEAGSEVAPRGESTADKNVNAKPEQAKASENAQDEVIDKALRLYHKGNITADEAMKFMERGKDSPKYAAAVKEIQSAETEKERAKRKQPDDAGTIENAIKEMHRIVSKFRHSAKMKAEDARNKVDKVVADYEKHYEADKNNKYVKALYETQRKAHEAINHIAVDFTRASNPDAAEKIAEVKELRDELKKTPKAEDQPTKESKDKETSRKSERAKGNTVDVLSDNGKEYKARYRLIEVDDVVTSNNPTSFDTNADYPKELQPRDRQRVGLKQQITSMTGNLRPADLAASRNLNQGAPIVYNIDGKNIVLNGNGRSMAIIRALKADHGANKPKSSAGARYRAYLKEHAAEFGIPADAIDKMRDPVLVREITDNLTQEDTQDIIGSTAGGSRMSASEQAQEDAKKITLADLDEYKEGNIDAPANSAFVRGILNRVINTSDMNAYMDRKGNISADGLVRVKRALFALAYGDENLISKMAESVDDEIKNVSTALMNAAPTVARANLLMRNGQRKKMDIAKTITDAIKKYEHLKKTNMPVQGYLDSTSLFDDISDASKDILAFLDRNKRKVRAIADMMKNLATNIINSDNPQEGSLFGGAAVKNPTLKDYVETAIKQAEIRDNPNEGILSFGAPQETTKSEKQETALSEKAENKGETAKEESKPATEQASNSEATTQESEAQEDNSIFGSVEDADKELFETLGINPDEDEKKLTAPEGITNTAEERAKLEAELMKELNKISANPVFNPKIYELGVRLAMTYVKDGINTIKKLIAKLNATFGDKIGPWAPAIAETVSTWPKGVKFDEKAVRAISKAIGARYERGIRTREAMHEDMKKSLKGSYETFAPMIDAAYNGIEKFFNQEAEGNGNRSEQEQSGRRGQANAGEHSGGTEEVQGGTENRGETIPERPREGNGSDTTVERPKAENGSTAKENGNTQGVRSGLSGEKGRQTDESTESRNDGDGREGGGQSGASPMGRGGRRAGGNDNRPGGTGSTGNADVVKENYHMDNPDALLGGTPKVRFARNKKAIETIQDIMATHRDPTQEEKEAMAAFTGWGSFGQELFQGTYDNPKPKAGWEKESEWLRDTLGKEEWESAQKSILNAHYTAPPIVTAMWDMVKRMGFNGGRVLEPSMGVGNFFALMPKGMERVSKLFGIEMDTMTGKMAQALYPQANIQIKPYQDSHVADGTYDLIISNVPFANFSPADRRYDKYKATLHDYFYLKGIDELRAGGIMIAITSNGTMDKANRATRIALAKKAELVGAYRLPTGAFKEYAGTNVVTDILVFKKRESPLLDVSNEEWLGTTEHQGNERDENGDYYKYRVNNYFENHPDHVLGNMGFGHGTTTGRPGLVVTMDANKYEQQIADMVKSIPQNIYEEPHYDKNLKYESNNANDRLGTLQVINGKLYVANGTESKPRELYKDWQFSSSLKNPETIKARLQELKDLVTLRLAYNKLEDAEKNDAPDLEKLRKELKKVYDAHVAKYCMDKNGKPKIVHYTAYDDDGNKVRKTRPMILEDTNGLKMFEKAGEPNYASLCALQRKDGKPADILLHRVMRQGTKDIKNPSVSEALMIQRNQSMIINVDKIAEMAHKSKDEVLKELGDKLFKTPTGEYQVRDQYLSGNVRRKLREAQEALNNGDTSMKRNIEALKEVMPEDIPYYNISANMGATWVGLPYYKEFIQHLLGATGIEDKIDVGQDVTGSWTVSILDPSLKKSAAATSTYGTSDVPFDRLLTHAFNHTSPTITYKDDKGTTHKDEQAMERAKEKINTIRSEFENWIWADEKRKIDLSHNYNETLNCTAIPQYDGSFLDMKGMMLTRGDKPFNLRQHQINAIYRGLVNGSGIYAHEVGTGKTYTMGGLAIESRRFGLAKKPLILAHNANSATVAKEIQEMYPGAKILYISGDSKTALRDLMRAKVDDWDVIVLPHSKTNLLTLKSETLEALAEDIIAQLEDDAREAAKIDGIGSIDIISVEDSLEMDHDDIVKQIGHIRSQTAKQLLLQRLKLIETIKKNAYNASKEGAIPFEDLGIDMIIVDESHDYKKPPFSTKMKVKGLQKGTSSMSIQLDFLSQYVQSQNNGRGVHLFTGTPITNTITEVYHNMKYVMPQQMKEANIYNFDDWFNTFAVINSEMEYTATGDVANIERLNSFVNVAELRRMIGQYMDVVFADDMPEFHPRMTPTGKTLMDKDLTPEERDYLIDGRDEAGEGRPYMQTITEVVPMNGAQKEILSMLQRYAKQWENAKPAERKKIMKEQSPQAPLYVESSAHAAAMDARLYDIDADVGDGDSKEKRLVKNVKQIYDSDERTTQVIMLDTGKSDSAERILRDKLGYPLEEADAETGKIPKEKVKMFNLQKDIIKSLVEAGIPRGEIAEVTGTTNADKKKEIAEQVDKGIIRVVIGSTATLGTGVNMQTNLKAIHHMDAPWMPGELEQRNGRILRQGNKWNTVLQYRYVTEKLDGRRWQVLSTKSKFIKMFMKADDSLRILDGDAVDMSDGEGGGDDIAQTLSEATGDPRFLKKANLEAQLEKLEKQYNIFVAGIDEAKYKLEKLKGGKLDEMRSDVDKLKKMRDSYAKYVESHGKDSYEITIGGKTYTERSQADAAIQKYFKDHNDKIKKYFKVGEFAGLNLYGYRTPLDGGGYKNDFYMTPDDKIVDGFFCTASPGGLTSKLGKIESAITKKENELKANENDVKTYEKQVKSTFPRMDILTAKRKEYKALEEDLLNNPVPPPQWLVESAPIGTEVLVDGNKGEVETYRIRIDSDDEKFYYAGVKFEGEKETKFIPWQDVEDTQGLKLINAPTEVKPSPEYKYEYENQKTNVVATEGMFDKITRDDKPVAEIHVGYSLLDNAYKKLENLAKKYNGNNESRGTFVFGTESDRDTFIKEANKSLEDYEAEGRRAERAKDETTPREATQKETPPEPFVNGGYVSFSGTGKLSKATYDRLEKLATFYGADEGSFFRNEEDGRFSVTFDRQRSNTKRDSFVNEAKWIIYDDEEYQKSINGDKASETPRTESTQGTASETQGTEPAQSDDVSKYKAADSRMKVDGSHIYINLEGIPHKRHDDITFSAQSQYGSHHVRYTTPINDDETLYDIELKDESPNQNALKRVKKWIDEKYPIGENLITESKDALGTASEGASKYEAPDSRVKIDGNHFYLNLEGVNSSQVRDIGRQIQEIGGKDLKPVRQVEGSDYLIEYNTADESISRAIKKAIDESYPKVAKQESETPSHFTKSMFNGKYAASNDKKVDYQTYKKLNALAVDEHNGRYHKKGGGTFYGFVFDSEADRDAFVKDADNLLNDGKTQFSVSEVQDGEELKQRAIEDVDTEVHKAFNGVEGINYERQADGTFTYSFDVSGRHVDIGVGNNINVGEEQGARAKAEHGIKRNATITVNGVTATREGMASILLSRLSKAAGAIYHEAFHVAYNLFLNEKERAAIEKAFKKAADANGMTIEEYAADRYREWVIAKVKGKHVAFAKLWEKVNNGAQTTVELMDAVTEAAQVFDEIESGRVWKRENGIDNKQAKVYDEIKDEIEAGHLPQTFMQEAREFVADVHAKIDGLQEIPDSTLDQIFFSSKAVKSARSEFNYYLNNNEERAFNASLKFDLLGRLFEHDESVKGFRGANSESVGSTSTQRVYGENDKGEPRDAARGSNQEGESGSGKRVRRSPKVISAIKTNDVKRIHDYYENNKNKYGVNRARNNNRTLGRPDNRGGFSVAENPDADIHFSLAGERGATRLDRHGEHLKRALMEAKRMRKAGATDSEIWEKTGWKWGRDGRPRFEIPDNLDKITLPTKAGTYRLGDIYDNERLYQAYPDFRKMKVTIESPTQEGARIRRGDYGEALPGNIILNKAKFSREPLEVKKTIVHEVQHIIQDREGFATGGSMDDVTDVLINKAAKEIADENITETEADDYISAMFDARDAQRDLKKNNLTKAERDRAQAAVTRAMAKIKKYEATLPKSTVKKAKDAFKRVKDADKYDAYMNLGGEQEAREVEERATNKTSAAPTIHNDDALITFDGTSIAMKQEKTPTLDDAPTKEDIEKQGDNFAKRTMAKALDTVERKMHLKGDNIEVIDAELSGPSSKNLGFIDRYWASPSRIAEKMPAFRPYFEMADKAMMVLKQTRTHFQRRLDNAMKLVKDKSDRENLFEILWQGDAEGKEYTADELREMGASDNVIDAYRGVRSMMEKAYNMLNEARMQYVTHSEHVTEGRLAELRNDKFVKIIRVKDTGDDLLVTYKSRNHWKREYHNLAPEMVELLKQDDNIQVIRAKLEDKTRPEAGYVVTVNESVGNLTKRGGYIPHFFHDYFVKKVDEEGREVTVGSGRTVREAVEAAEAWKANHKLGKMEKLIISPKVYNFGGKSEADYGAIMGDREYKNMVKQIAKNNDMTIKEAKELTEDAVRRTSRHRFFGNFKKRTGAEGFEQDMGWVLRHYFNSAARYYALETEFKPKAISLYERQYGAFDKVPKSDVADYVRDYINDVNGVPSKLEESINRALMSNKFFSRFIASNFGERAGLSVGNKLSNIVSVAKLGVFNVSSAVINLTQITNAAAVLGDVSILWKGIYKGANTHHSIADVRVWQETGVLDETGIDSNGYDKNRAYSMLGRIGNASMFMFTSVEGILRRGTTLAAYEKAIKKGKSHREAIRYAQEVDRKVNFEYGVQDAPNVFRRGSIISQLLLQFKKYPIKELELMHEMSLFSNKATTKQKLIFWGLYFAMAGLFGIPFSDLPDEILELAGAKARPKMAIKRAIMEWAGDSPFKKMLAQIAIYGVGSQAGIDISSRAGIGDIMPTSLKDFSGATISTLIDVIGAAASADPVKAITALSPGAGNIIKAYTGESIGKRGRVNTKYDTAHDRICRLLGFRSLGEAVDSDVTYMRSLEKSEKTSERQEAIDAYIENPTNENAKKLKELGVKRRDVEKEREKKRLSRQERTTGNMKKGERDAYTTLYNFAK